MACFAALPQGSVAGSYREALNKLYIQPHITTLTSILTTSPTIVCITTSLHSPNLLQWQSSQLPGYLSQLELLNLGRENGTNIGALDAPSRHRARPHSCSWSVISSKKLRDYFYLLHVMHYSYHRYAITNSRQVLEQQPAMHGGMVSDRTTADIR